MHSSKKLQPTLTMSGLEMFFASHVGNLWLVQVMKPSTMSGWTPSSKTCSRTGTSWMRHWALFRIASSCASSEGVWWFGESWWMVGFGFWVLGFDFLLTKLESLSSHRSWELRYDFSKFLAEYEACHMNYVRMKFAEASWNGHKPGRTGDDHEALDGPLERISELRLSIHDSMTGTKICEKIYHRSPFRRIQMALGVWMLKSWRWCCEMLASPQWQAGITKGLGKWNTLWASLSHSLALCLVGS